MKEAIKKLVSGHNLDFQEAKRCFEDIFKNKATDAQIASFLTALNLKGESLAEISAAATVIRDNCHKIKVKDTFLDIEQQDDIVMDTCGTGGSGLNKFNISTAVAFIVSSFGVKVAKHGNRAMSSTCGSADVLEHLGVNINVKPHVMEKSIKTIGIGFLYAPLYHPVLGRVAALRKEIGIKSIFNILGPLCNPAFATHQLLGVHSRYLCDILARVLKKLGVKKSFVVFGKDLRDEISLTGPTHVSYLKGRSIENITLKPSDFGLKKVTLKDLLVRNVKESARLIKDVLKGEKGPPRNVVLANASACFYVLGKTRDLKEGVKLSSELIDSGKAKSKITEFKEFLEENA
ncbi:MAG: anthranilate phosphoribosyltransferase [Candidatus Omnitrophica bacterium]|nr:anthranilate phosphoribosyltransferase [Candidatus Omnitrophota bacterium]MBD3268638.1 anthranilate phosphoribosyltransferase [Candidatus Omnitrophota bacterium]